MLSTMLEERGKMEAVHRVWININNATQLIAFEFVQGSNQGGRNDLWRMV
jgi:hypothetical protein